LIEIILLVVLVALAAYVIGIYNRLVALKHRVVNAFAQIDVQLKRRHDLIPKIVEVAKQYMSYERATLEAIVTARGVAQEAGRAAAARPTDPKAIAAVAAAEGRLTGALRQLFAVAEAYPDLKANQSMVQLSEEVTSTENRIAFARQAFNDAVMNLNIALEAFPAVLFAAALGFKSADMLQPIGSEPERQPPEMKF
jgi:LemA protein